MEGRSRVAAGSTETGRRACSAVAWMPDAGSDRIGSDRRTALRPTDHTDGHRFHRSIAFQRRGAKTQRRRDIAPSRLRVGWPWIGGSLTSCWRFLDREVSEGGPRPTLRAGWKPAPTTSQPAVITPRPIGASVPPTILIGGIGKVRVRTRGKHVAPGCAGSVFVHERSPKTAARPAQMGTGHSMGKAMRSGSTGSEGGRRSSGQRGRRPLNQSPNDRADRATLGRQGRHRRPRLTGFRGSGRIGDGGRTRSHSPYRWVNRPPYLKRRGLTTSAWMRTGTAPRSSRAWGRGGGSGR